MTESVRIEAAGSGDVQIRAARRDDVPLVFALVKELAEYERAAERVVGSEELLEQALFGGDPVAEAVIAELGGGRPDEPAPVGFVGQPNEPEAVGFALFFRTFSTWLCRPGLWLEDLYVSPRYRRSGVGRVLLTHVAQVAVDRGYGRVEWSVLDWNTPALHFYDSIGATRLHEWEICRLDGSALRAAAQASQG